MIRTLLATTALAAVLAVPAFAQDASSSMADSSAMMESSAMTDSSMMSSETMSSETPMDASSSMLDSSMDSSMSSETPMDTSSSVPMDTSSSMVTSSEYTPFDITTGYTQIDTDRLASHIIGQPVYDGTAADANNLGNINDLVLNESGDVAAVVIGVGGFLGLGEKQVAVDYAALQWVIAADNTERFVLDTTVEQLTAAPDFVTVDDDPADDTTTSSSAM